VLFRNAYSNNPICCPSRASMMSGLYTHHCEGWNNHKGLSEGDRTYEDDLADVGYRIGIFGKTDYGSGRHSSRARVTAWTRSAMIERPAYRMGPPTVIESDEKRVHERDWDDVDDGIAWLRDEVEGVDATPFFLYFGIRSPHPEFRTSRHYLDMIDESLVDVPAAHEYSHPALDYQERSKNWRWGLDSDTVRLVRRIYFAQIAEVDAMLGSVLEAVDELDLGASPTIVFSSDHGELALEHNQFYKMSPFEGSVRVPLIVSGPSFGEGVEVETPVSLLDIYPTFADIGGFDRPDTLDGYSLVPELTGQPTEHPGWVLSEYHDSTMCTGTFMLREGPWKYIVYVGFRPQLFNIEDDPGELVDLADKHPDVIARMDALLRGVVDPEAVDAKVEAYDRACFTRWREDALADGTYRAQMAHIYSGFDDMEESDADPWTDDDERLIEAWLAAGV
jgi:arylsulfatase K